MLGVATESAVERMRGLIGRDPLASGVGFWIKPCSSIHMWFMRSAIDVVYLNRDGRVLKLVQGIRPWRMSLCWSANSVVELAAGEIARLDVQIGDQWLWFD